MAKPTAKKSKQPFAAVLIAIAVIGAATLGYVASRPKGGAVAIDPNLPPGTAEGYSIGDPKAPVKITEFADFECPACGQFATLTEPDLRQRLIATGFVQMTFYDFPLPMHKNTWSASNAAACAHDQGKFWEMHDRLFYAQDLWNGEATSSPEKKMKAFAKDLGLDQGKFDECFDSQKHYPKIKANGQEAERRGVSQTPTFIIGDKMYPGSLPYDEFKKLVDAEIAKMGAAAPAKKDGK